MELILTRIAKQKTYTIGRLEMSKGFDSDGAPIDSTYLCDTLEPTWRDYKHGAYKMKGKSAIPDGRYAVVISYSPKFRCWLPILLGGPEFNSAWKGIRIHAGNTANDTEGCILVGKNREVGKVLDSRLWLHRVIRAISNAKERGEAVHITIR